MSNTPARAALINDIQTKLGVGMIRWSLKDRQYQYAVNTALARYRVRSQNAMEESFVFIDAQPEVSVYTLPDEVQEVQALYRRSIGSTAGGGQVDPFSLGWTNYIYSGLTATGGAGGAGGLATYDFAMQYQEMAGRLFGRDLLFTWDTATKRLTLHRKMMAVEQIACHCHLTRPEEVLYRDTYARPWLKDYAAAICKQIEGEARSKFGGLAGPQGGITLNGDALKNEAAAEIEKLEKEIDGYLDGHAGYGIVIG